MGSITVVTGGARSGKSSFAEKLAEEAGLTLGYIATARADDAEMADRIAKHQKRRDARWQTFEEPMHPAHIIATHGNNIDAFLLDCLTLLVTNLLLSQRVDWELPTNGSLRSLEDMIMAEMADLIEACTVYRGEVIMVSNEVGCGIVPPSPLARLFRDCAGQVNQCLAANAKRVYLVASGLPLCLKG